MLVCPTIVVVDAQIFPHIQGLNLGCQPFESFLLLFDLGTYCNCKGQSREGGENLHKWLMVLNTEDIEAVQ